MERLFKIRKFIENEYDENMIIETEDSYQHIQDEIDDAIRKYKPKIVLKLGIGHGKLLMSIAEPGDKYVIVLEPSGKNIEKFVKDYKNHKNYDKIRIINSDFNFLPIDYYSIDMVISIDHLDFIESSSNIDEFRRVLVTNGVLFISTIVLNENDLEGLYDEFIKELFPIHNEYYLENDLVTVLKLNGFNFINKRVNNIGINLSELIKFFAKKFDEIDESHVKKIDEMSDELKKMYSFNENSISLPYFTGIFLREKFDDTGAE